MNNSTLTDLFFHQLIDIVRIENPLENCDPQKRRQTKNFRAGHCFQITAKAALPTQWLINNLTVILVGRGLCEVLDILNVIDQYWGEDGHFHVDVRTWPTEPISLSDFTELHLLTAHGQVLSKPITSLTPKQVSHG